MVVSDQPSAARDSHPGDKPEPPPVMFRQPEWELSDHLARFREVPCDSTQSTMPALRNGCHSASAAPPKETTLARASSSQGRSPTTHQYVRSGSAEPRRGLLLHDEDGLRGRRSSTPFRGSLGPQMRQFVMLSVTNEREARFLTSTRSGSTGRPMRGATADILGMSVVRHAKVPQEAARARGHAGRQPVAGLPVPRTPRRGG